MPAGKRVSNRTVFYHPICHLANGERLHYLLLRVGTRLFEVGDALNKVINASKSGLEKSCCAYYIFGDRDVILRVWGNERQLDELIAELKKEIQGLEDVEVILVERTSTWYQREIEARVSTDWRKELIGPNILQIAQGNIPAALAVDVELSGTAATGRFFILIEEIFSKRSHLFSRLCDDLAEPMPEFFKDMKRVSIYSYTTAKAPGVIIKGEIADPKKLTIRLLEFAEKTKVFPVKTTTFICPPKIIRPENNQLNHSSARSQPFNARSSDIFYNLIRTHDSNYRQIADYGGETALKRAQRFDEIGRKLIEELFEYSNAWWGLIGDLRLLYKWVAFGDFSKVIQKLSQEYVELDRDLSDLLEGCYQKMVDRKIGRVAAKISHKRKLPEQQARELLADALEDFPADKHVTLGRVPNVLKDLVTSAKPSPAIKAVIEEFGRRLADGAEHRNLLMHGRVDVTEFSRSVDQKAWVWEGYIENYIRVALMYPKVKSQIDDLADVYMKA